MHGKTKNPAFIQKRFLGLYFVWTAMLCHAYDDMCSFSFPYWKMNHSHITRQTKDNVHEQASNCHRISKCLIVCRWCQQTHGRTDIFRVWTNEISLSICSSLENDLLSLLVSARSVAFRSMKNTLFVKKKYLWKMCVFLIQNSETLCVFYLLILSDFLF